MDKAKVRSMLRCVLVLAAIALCSGLLLGAFNILTYVDPLQSTYERFAADTGAKFSKMTDEDGKAYGDGSVVYYAVSDDGAYHAFLAEGKGYQGGKLQIYLYIKDGVIYKTGYGEVDSSQTLINDVKNAGLLESFEGKDVADIDALSTDVVTNATYTSKGVLNAVNAAVQYYNEGNGQEVLTQSLREEMIAGGESNG